ncbi:MAG: hypothetical protein KKA19_01215 [Candidatus Margulisbacteria bacterium]|nr:hypothetical protein [Candidatus Margulisiibacteriota bacterium]
MRRIWILLIIVVTFGFFAQGNSISSIERKFEKDFYGVDKNTYLNLYENAAFLIKNQNMYLVKNWQQRDAAYLYGCDKQGQLKAFVNMEYAEEVLKVKLIMTYDGPEAEQEGSNIVDKIGQCILSDMEKYANIDTVRVLARSPLRIEPNIKSKKIKYLKKGELYILLEAKGEWFFIKSIIDPKVEGWVYKSYLKKR